MATDTPQQIIAKTLVDRLGAVTLPREVVVNLAWDAVACVEALEAAGYRIMHHNDDTADPPVNAPQRQR